MIKKEEVLAKLEAFKAYSIAHAEEKQEEYEGENYESYYTSMIEGVHSAVNSYFDTHNPEFDSTLKLIIFNMYCHTWDVNAEYDDNLEREINTNIPIYYNDLREIYYKFPIVSLSEEEFFDAWVYGEEPSEDDGTGAPKPIIPLSNPYLTTLRTDLVGTQPASGQVTEPDDAQSLELGRLKTLLNWLESASDLSLVELLEESGLLVKTLSTKEIGTIIYRDRGVKEIITNKGYNVYIPTYMRGV